MKIKDTMIKDSHAHIYLEDFDEDLAEVILDADAVGVAEIYMPNIDSTTIDRMHSVEERFSNCKSMMGLHPCYVKENYKEELRIVEEHLGKRKYSAVGEIGIDLYWDKTFAEAQFESFRYQIELARNHKIGFAIHSRDALDDTIAIVSEMQDGNLKGVFHCFNGTLDQAKKIIDLGFYLGIGGVVTYKNAGVDKTVAQLPLTSMVLETDSPYLSPGPKRVKRNVPSRIPLVINRMQEILDVDREEIAKLTTINCENLFSY
ncbi:MAG: TatD DNase family protein [Saprospiraceae bacterium]|jgi:TatD DNase family protein